MTGETIAKTAELTIIKTDIVSSGEHANQLAKRTALHIVNKDVLTKITVVHIAITGVHIRTIAVPIAGTSERIEMTIAGITAPTAMILAITTTSADGTGHGATMRAITGVHTGPATAISIEPIDIMLPIVGTGMNGLTLALY